MTTEVTPPAVGRVSIDDVAWVEYVDAADRLRTPAKVLSPIAPCVLLVKFAPHLHVAPHSHPFDVLYIPLKGQVDFGDPGEPPLTTGQIRWVKAGHTYGPEVGGPEGAEVLIISMDGAITIDWADPS